MTSDGRKPIKCGKCGAPIPNDGRLDHAAIAEGLGSELRCPNCVPAFVKLAMGALPGARAGDGYQAVPVDAARELAATYGKDVVVILAWDQRTNRTHLTTYGRTAEWKPAAARLGDICAKAAIGTCEPVTGTRYEDYRERTAASWAEERERLLQRIHVLETGIAQGFYLEPEERT